MKTDTTYNDWLTKTIKKFRLIGIESASLDALVLLEQATGTNRAMILAYPDSSIDEFVLSNLNKSRQRRINREPLAYIIGYKNFYRHNFYTTKDVMIPRPESESFLDLLAGLNPKPNQKLLDIGTGSGVLAISAKLMLPGLKVTACDISQNTLLVAKKNAKCLNAEIKFIESDLLSNVREKYDYIFANLPYVPRDFVVSPEITYEPRNAIFAKDGGLSIIKKAVTQTTGHLKNEGYLLIESLECQQADIDKFCSKNNFMNICQSNLVSLYQYTI